MKKIISAALSSLAAVCCCSFLFAAPPASAYEKIDAVIPVYCDDYGKGGHTYIIEIAPESSDAPAPNGDSITIESGKSGEFVITADEPGTFVYTVKETIGTDEGVEYDKSVFDVSLFVADKDDKLEYAIAVTKAGTDEKPDRLRFSNGGADEPAESLPDESLPDESQPEDSVPGKTDPSKTGGRGTALKTVAVSASAVGVASIGIFLVRRKRREEENETES